MDIQKFIDDNRAWTDQAFPGATAAGAMRHLKRECDEVIEALEQDRKLGTLTEMADCYLLLLNALSRADFTFESLHQMAVLKMEVNKKRTWGAVNAERFAEHVTK